MPNVPSTLDDRELAKKYRAILRALERGHLPLVGLAAILDELVVEGLIERSDQSWRLTDLGQTLVASRRQVPGSRPNL
jgi:predicted methyltransferase